MEDQDEVDKFRNILFGEGYTAKEVVGQSVQTVAERAGVEVPKESRVILLKSDGQADDVLRNEKMCPVLAVFAYDNLEEAIEIARDNLEIKGKGHTCVIHSNNVEPRGSCMTLASSS